ncbi:MAG: UvrD-helicase domain-containing protein [Burkholderiales bacterium]|nr:UvrD-helicase domain-containing protein [Burkholderiales bacterium]
MSDTSRQLLNRAALDPSSSVVIEACAGSGKTWLLVSRIVRLLLAGAEPSHILAVTFTRKAAQEMAARLHEWLHLLATAPDAAVRDFLQQREVGPEDIEAMLPRARRLYEKLLTAQPSITITTFHSWFMQLLRRAPLDAGVPGDVTLVEQTAALVDEAWERFAGSLSRNPDAPAARGLTFLFRECGLENTRQLLTGFLRRRAEWWSYTRSAAEPVDHALAQIARCMTVTPDADVTGSLLADAGFVSMLGEYAALLERNTATDRQFAAVLQKDPGVAGRERFENIRAVLFTATEGTLRKRKPSPTQAKRLTPAGEVRLLELHAALGERIEAVHDALRDQDNYRFNEAGLRCGAGLLEAYQSLKRERQVIDYGDIEWRACELVRVSDHAAYMHCKLDARYHHILVDEFQDTNPLQWLTLQSWLEAAVDADSRPTVFMVGDPKQSIYRFRRAEARLFTLAQGYLEREFAAQRLAQNESRRCAQPVIDVVNRVFGAEPEYAGFAPHAAYHRQMPGRVEVLPLAAADAVQETLPPAGLRDPLLSPLLVEEDRRRDDEAALLARQIGVMVGRWLIDDGHGGRPLRCADIMILVRRRTHLAVYERALRHAGIPFVTSRQGGLLDTLEAQDLIALLRFLSSPFSDLDLAHALRSPLFAAGDDDLVAIALTPGDSWWERLVRLAAQPLCSPTLLRAHDLLARWLSRADAAPVHDQLDRIYFEGGLMHRYAQAVPAAMRGAVAANLQAFIQHALDADAGRYPSLPRFINELGDLRSAPVEEAPDEGIIGDAGDALRIYTVHGAKGLEAPVVWLLDTAAGQDAGRGYEALIDWPPEAERPLMFSLWTRKDAQSTAQRAQARHEAALAAREDLNLLYVAMTRARQALIVSGVDGRGRNGSSWYARIRTAVCAAAGVADDDPAAVAAHGAMAGEGGAVPAAATPATAIAAVDARLTQPLPTGRRISEPAGEGLRFGTLFHLLLERLTAGPPAAPPVLRDAMGLTEAEFLPLWEAAQRLLKQAGLKRFFDPAQYVRAMNELAFVDATGAMRRIDRLVEFGDVLWVIDYKSGTLPGDAALLARYDAQLAGYRDAISAMYPRKPVRAMLIFSSGETRETAAA